MSALSMLNVDPAIITWLSGRASDLSLEAPTKTSAWALPRYTTYEAALEEDAVLAEVYYRLEQRGWYFTDNFISSPNDKIQFSEYSVFREYMHQHQHWSLLERNVRMDRAKRPDVLGLPDHMKIPLVTIAYVESSNGGPRDLPLSVAYSNYVAVAASLRVKAMRFSAFVDRCYDLGICGFLKHGLLNTQSRVQLMIRPEEVTDAVCFEYPFATLFHTA